MPIFEKGWCVRALPDDPLLGTRPVKSSRTYHVREAAEQYAALLRGTSQHPESVEVVCVRGYEK